ncbi:MAG: hypothetical protein JXR07_11855 [Reichenbachiella sp.]
MERISEEMGRFLNILIGVVFIIAIACDEKEDEIGGVNIPETDGHEWLSQYNFFLGDIADLVPNDQIGLLPYDLNVPLFSDYALKKRFVYVPEGETIPYQSQATLDLPIGSVLIKHFYYERSGQNDNYIETRLLIHRSDGWHPETYIWNEDLSDARRSLVGGVKQLTIEVNGQNQALNYLIPNQNQCINCHAKNGQINPIGTEVPNLNKSYEYQDGLNNQLDKWVMQGILEDPGASDIPSWPEMDNESSSLNDRARAYLAVNCSSCHRLEGSAANSGLYLEYHNQDSLSLGFKKTPVAAGDGSGGLKYVIEPGNAEESILHYRINSSELEVRMPELGRALIHEEGVALIKEWIDNMD